MIMACACLLTALLGPGDFPNVRGGFQSTDRCSTGTFYYRNHSIILQLGQLKMSTFVDIVIPRINQTVTLSYCLMSDQAYIGAMSVPVTIHTDEVAT